MFVYVIIFTAGVAIGSIITNLIALHHNVLGEVKVDEEYGALLMFDNQKAMDRLAKVRHAVFRVRKKN